MKADFLRRESAPAEQSPFGTSLLAEIRSRFHYVDEDPFSHRKRIFFENGGGSLTLKSVVTRSAEVMAVPDGSSRNNPAAKWLLGTLNEGEKAVRCFLGTEAAGQIVIGSTGTDIMFRFAHTILSQSQGGSVVSSLLEHAASHDAAGYWAQALDFEQINIPLPADTAIVGAQDYAAAVRADTVLATVIHTSHVSGMRVDVPAIVSAIRTRAPQCYILCDGIQHAAHGPVDVANYGVDAYIYSPYKAFSHRSGAFGWINDRLKLLPHEKMEGKPADNWNLGGRDPALFAGQAAQVEYLIWLGGHFTIDTDDRALVVAAMSAIGAHEASLIHLLLFGKPELPGLLKMQGVAVIGEDRMTTREGAVSFHVRGHSALAIVAALEEMGIRTHYRLNEPASSSRYTLQSVNMPDCVRVSFCHYNTASEVERLLTALPAVIGRSAQDEAT